MGKPFLQRVLDREITMDKIHDYIDWWHETESELPLHEFLGMTENQYGQWVENPDWTPF